MKKKTLLSSILTIVLCLSLIAGTTYALFTSEDEVNISVSSGKVEIKAVIKDWNFASTLGTTLEGSSASISEADQLLTLTNIVPGDYVTFNIEITNTSNVSALYRTAIWVTEDNGIFEKLEITVGDAEFNGTPAVSPWEELAPAENGTTITVPVRIELPVEVAGEEYMNKTCKIAYKVEAVQGNADVKDATALEATMMYGGSYTLTQDETGDFTVSENVKVDIELNDNALNNTLTNNGEVTVSGGTINAEGNNAIYNEGTAELKDVTVNMTGSTGYITNSRTEDSVTVYENVTATSTGGGVNVWEGEALFKSGTITTNSTSTSARHMFYVANGATLTIEDGEFFFSPTNLTRKGSYICADTNATVIVKGGTFHKPSTRTAPIQALNGSTVTIYGGTFYFDPSAFVAEGYRAMQNGSTWVVVPEEVDAIVSDNASFNSALAAGNDTIMLGSGNYIIPDSAQGKTLTIIGNGVDTVIATQDDGSYEGCDYSLDGATVTFEGITINTDSTTYTGYARLKATYNNCTINGTFTLYDDSVFNNCTFNVSGDVYNIWTWGATNATFNNCTFNSDGKALLLYGGANTTLTVNKCTFIDKGGLTDLKAAIEIGNDYNTSFTLIVTDTIVNGYEINDKGINTGSTLWANKNSMSQEKLNVIVDGVDVY